VAADFWRRGQFKKGKDVRGETLRNKKKVEEKREGSK